MKKVPPLMILVVLIPFNMAFSGTTEKDGVVPRAIWIVVNESLARGDILVLADKVLESCDFSASSDQSTGAVGKLTITAQSKGLSQNYEASRGPGRPSKVEWFYLGATV